MQSRAVSFIVRSLALASVAFVIASGCGGALRSDAQGLGDPCTPSIERRPGFLGFREQEVTIENGASQCRSQVCLVNHFRGKVTAPYGDADVPPQCVDRATKAAVYCSCRCANAAGKTDDADDYCSCSDGFECASLVSSIGTPDDHESGSYCIKKGTAYDSASSCASSCDPDGLPCP
jgi:hypothetical protein